MKLTKRKALGALLLSIIAIALIGTYQGWISVPGISTWLFSPPLIPVGPDFKLLMGENMTWNQFVNWLKWATASPSEIRTEVVRNILGSSGTTPAPSAHTPSTLSQVSNAMKKIEGLLTNPSSAADVIAEAFGLKGWPSWSPSLVTTLPDGKTPADWAAQIYSSPEGRAWCQAHGINSQQQLEEAIKADLVRGGNDRLVDKMCMDLKIGTVVLNEKGEKVFVPASAVWRADLIRAPGAVSASFDWVKEYEYVAKTFGKKAADIWVKTAAVHEWYSWSDRDEISKKADPNIYEPNPVVISVGSTPFWIDPVTGKAISMLPE
ncbi:MAG: hypothetical protein QXQ76_01020, partial [Candidatus Bathyarchaeia archaeon]